MMSLKKKHLQVLPYIVLLIITSLIQYNNLKNSYEGAPDTSGIGIQNLEGRLMKENEKARQEQTEYQKLLQDQEEDNISYLENNASVLEENNTPDSDNSKNNSGNSNADNNSTEAAETKPIKEPKLHSLSALLLDADNNRVLYEENGYDKVAMASTTKIMTCIVALELGKLDDVVTVSSYASKMPDVQLNIRAGEQYYLRDLLYSLMLESHNDTAVAIAEHIGGSVEGFATMMNDKARELGCDNTNFVTPNGLDAEGHYTTARDLAVIASYAITNDQFVAITNTSSHAFQELKKGRSFTVSNKNRFLYMMEGAIGVKTGFTGDAGYCFVGAVKRQDRTLISVVLGCGWPPNKSLKWTDTRELMNYGINNYSRKQIFETVELNPLLVEDGQQQLEPLVMKAEDLSLLLRADEKVSVKYALPDYLEAPVKANAMVGYARYFINDTLYKEVPIYSTRDIAKIDLKYCFQRIFNLWKCK